MVFHIVFQWKALAIFFLSLLSVAAQLDMCVFGIYSDLFFAHSLHFFSQRAVGVLGPKQELFAPSFALAACVTRGLGLGVL